MVNTASVLQFMFPSSVPLRDWVVRQDNADSYIAEWRLQAPQPTSEEIEASRPAAEVWWARKRMPHLTPAQMDLALLNFDLLDAVEAFIAQADRATQIAYRRVNSFERSNPMLCNAAELLGKTPEELDAVFAYGATLNPGA